MVWIRDGDERAGSFSAALADWRGGVGALLLGSSGGTLRLWPVCQAPTVTLVVAVSRRILAAGSGALKAVETVHRLLGGFLRTDPG